MTDPVILLTSLLSADQVVAADRLPTWLTQMDRSPTLVYPHSEAELAAVMACAHQQQWRLLPCGGGSKLAWGGPPAAIDLVVSTARLNQVIDHAVGDMTLTVQAGVRLADLETPLANQQQWLAMDPAYGDRATLGGIVATADIGALRQRYGSVRDRVIGLTLVRHDGEIARAGGRVVKNVAGYDLMKLMTGSYGTLGVISQLTLRLYPIPDTSKTMVVTGPAEVMTSLTAKVRASTLTPVALDLLSPRLVQALELPPGFGLAARFQSLEAGVEEQIALLRAMVPAECHGEILVAVQEEQFWHGASTILYGTPSAPPDLLAKIGVPPTAAMPLLESLTSLLPHHHLARFHGGNGIGSLRLEGESVELGMVKALRSRCHQVGGYLTLHLAPSALKTAIDVWDYQGKALGLMGKVKAEFDPQHRLSPGRFVGGL
ncbi:MAG: FAD-binding oxidoreductase [Nodosilinea sp.]